MKGRQTICPRNLTTQDGGSLIRLGLDITEWAIYGHSLSHAGSGARTGFRG